MHTQQQLFSPITQPANTNGLSIRERFERFHAANPHVFTLLKNAALKLKSCGITRYGVKALFEKLRYDWAVETKADQFQLNNIYTAHYARLLMSEVPQLAGFFETRELKAD